MEESFGIEYFLLNDSLSFLMSVNWYVIEVLGHLDAIVQIEDTP